MLPHIVTEQLPPLLLLPPIAPPVPSLTVPPVFAPPVAVLPVAASVVPVVPAALVAPPALVVPPVLVVPPAPPAPVAPPVLVVPPTLGRVPGDVVEPALPPALGSVVAEVLPPGPVEPPVTEGAAFPPLGPASETVDAPSPLELHDQSAKEQRSTMRSLGAMWTMMAPISLCRNRPAEMESLSRVSGSRGIKNRMDFFRGALGHYLRHLGAEGAAALFADATAA